MSAILGSPRVHRSPVGGGEQNRSLAMRSPASKMSMVLSDMSNQVWGVPVFSFFGVYDHGIAATTKHVGDISSVDELGKLVPAADTRIEIDRTTDHEEVRVVSSENGDYHGTSSASIAREVIAKLDAQTAEVFEFDVKAYPDDFSAGEEKNNDQSRHIIQYDHEGKRILPGIRRAGYLSTMAEYKAMEGGAVCWYEDPEFVGVTDTSTGDVWWATEELKKEVLIKVAEQDDGDRACGMDEGSSP